jgi:ankyrin repeat protein
MFGKKEISPLIEMRNNILQGITQFHDYYGSNEIAAIITDIGAKKGGVSLVCIGDDSCSLYFENGGGIIGAGEHKNVQIVSKIFMNAINQLLIDPVDNFDLKYPKTDNFRVKIITKYAKYQMKGKIENNLTSDTIPGKVFTLVNDVITQVRLISENDNEFFSDDVILINFIKENNYNAFIAALNDFKNPNAIEEDKSALMVSVYSGNIPILKELINHGAAIDYKDHSGLNSLMIACYLGKHEFVDLLTDNKTIEEKDKDGYTPLIYASNAGKIDCVNKLLQLKADVNATDNDNSTPIMFAAQHGYDSIVNVLLINGADKNIKGNHGLTALDFAIQNKHKSTMKLLQK